MPLKPSGDTTGRPRVFIGSSSEGLGIANNLQVLLDYECEVEVWSQGLFEPGGSTLASLAREAPTFDFAVLIVTPDDRTETRDEMRRVTRDNVLFELGLFMGALGSDRVYMVYDRNDAPDLPTDLLGITAITYNLHKSGNMRASLGASATQLSGSFHRLGLRSPEIAEEQPLRERMETRRDPHTTPASGAAEDAVIAMLDRFVNFSRSTLSREVHDHLVAAGWTPSTPSKSTYLRWTYSGRRQVSIYQNSAQLLVAANQLVDLVRDMPGAEVRPAKNEVVFKYLDGAGTALNAAEAIRVFAAAD